VRKGVIATPPVTVSILEGITRDTVIKVARDMGYTVEERDIAREELYTSHEISLTGTAAKITPVVEVDGVKVGGGAVGPTTSKLKDTYRRIVMREEPRHTHWLTPVY